MACKLGEFRLQIQINMSPPMFSSPWVPECCSYSSRLRQSSSNWSSSLISMGSRSTNSITRSTIDTHACYPPQALRHHPDHEFEGCSVQWPSPCPRPFHFHLQYPCRSRRLKSKRRRRRHHCHRCRSRCHRHWEGPPATSESRYAGCTNWCC